MKLQVDSVVFHRDVLVLGIIVRGPRGSWVRFASLEVPLEAVPFALVKAVAERRAYEIGEEDQDEPLPGLAGWSATPPPQDG
jgi:hypothetical protein